MTLTRSQNMARIKSKDTKPELLLRSALWRQGLRYRLQHRIANIRPDIVFVNAQVALFIDGCQWHGCPEHYVSPRTNREFWTRKLQENVERDTAQTELLRATGWIPYRIWEHDIWADLPAVVDRVKALVRQKTEPDIANWRVVKVEIVDIDQNLERRYLRLLESPDTERTVDQVRSTRKWSRSKSTQDSKR
jgi:DNA mismatch endonuclease, patch repair protein